MEDYPINLQDINVLLVEDNKSDARLMKEFLNEIDVKNLHIVEDGIEALNHLHNHCKPQNKYPHLIILDLNLPRKDGREVLKDIKNDNELKIIPVIVLTTSNSEEDINECYNNYANCFITKPVELDEFTNAIELITEFWLKMSKLPPY